MKKKKTDDTLSFSVEALEKEIQQYKGRIYSSGIRFLTKDQIMFLKICRERDNPLPYPKVLELWIKYGWRKFTMSTLAGYCRQLKNKKWKL